ncbi:MAG: SurA N-terminal domain-containing protein [Nitrospirota bacterium]
MHSERARGKKRLRLRSPFSLAVTQFGSLTLPFNITDTGIVAAALTAINLTFLLLFVFCSLLSAEIKDRVVAFVDDTAITLSELEEAYTEALRVNPGITEDEVLNTMVNRLLLLREAKKLRLEAPSMDELLREYIDLKIRAFIRIREKDLIDFYEKHLNDFRGKEFEAVREEIERYLIEKELNQRLKREIEELRQKAYIKIQLNSINKD